MNGLRDCVKFVQNIEHLQRWHYSVVVRLRDDTYALAPWIINSNYLGDESFYCLSSIHEKYNHK